ncbi:NO-inducible flavohemoprotein [Caryophanon tenue]|uniref:nitric oxide dioxygenase n=1 Tax=Caryophanon tenue TaxID=33978 RepID=A0A1C0YN39_9BACL|nr:NO-inducible flavohemoprotein [Caryophanon tenue]OCS88584.1 nitric oxide dioxygenase [Caryophanon tenue]
MLQQQTIETIKATVPVLAEHGTAITKTFYKNLFDAHPQLLNIFNQTNQRKGRQQGALANTVYAAAVHIENLEAILPAVLKIAHKHRSLGILPEHYPIVGEFLLAAIKEVLGDAATPAILEAWGQAYGVIADIFISVEEDLYVQAEANDGWRFFKEFVITNKQVQSDVATTFTLQRADGGEVPQATAGQYISLRTAIPGEEFLFNRQYTVTKSTANAYEITVKREDAADAHGTMSNYLHNAPIGTTVDVSVPAGDFVLTNEDAPILFISGGIGVTPLYAMLQTIENRSVSFLQYARNAQVAAFTQQISAHVDTLNGTYEIVYSDESGHIEASQIAPLLTAHTHVYVCGPTPFMEATLQHLRSLHVDPSHIHFEFFGPAIAFA